MPIVNLHRTILFFCLVLPTAGWLPASQDLGALERFRALHDEVRVYCANEAICFRSRTWARAQHGVGLVDGTRAISDTVGALEVGDFGLHYTELGTSFVAGEIDNARIARGYFSFLSGQAVHATGLPDARTLTATVLPWQVLPDTLWYLTGRLPSLPADVVLSGVVASPHDPGITLVTIHSPGLESTIEVAIAESENRLHHVEYRDSIGRRFRRLEFNGVLALERHDVVAHPVSVTESKYDEVGEVREVQTWIRYVPDGPQEGLIQKGLPRGTMLDSTQGVNLVGLPTLPASMKYEQVLSYVEYARQRAIRNSTPTGPLAPAVNPGLIAPRVDGIDPGAPPNVIAGGARIPRLPGIFVGIILLIVGLALRLKLSTRRSS